MKKKDLLQDWEIVQREYYEKFNRSAIAELWEEWFGMNEEMQDPYQNKDEIIEELIKDELEYRKDDTNEELKETIEHIEKINLIK